MDSDGAGMVLTEHTTEELNRLLLDSLPHPAVVIERGGRILAANQAAREAGVNVGTECVREFGDAIRRADRDETDRTGFERLATALCAFCRREESFEAGEPKVARGVAVGERIWDVHWIPVSERICLHYAVDVSRQRRDQQQQIAAERAQTIASLAAGVVHHLNNTLAVILGTASVVQRELSPSSSLTEDITRIIEAAVSGDEVLRTLTVLARPPSAQRERLDVNEAVEGIIEIVRLSTPEDVVVRLDLAPSNPAVQCDAVAIGHLVTSLVENAVRAVREGGEVTVSTSEVEVGPAEAPALGLTEARYLLLEVSDDGVGMTPETAARAFEPFFTTRRSPRATGLGLTVARKTAESHGGAIRVISEPGRGTRASAWLPAAPGAAAERTAPELPRSANGRARTILVVDDLKPVRRVIAKMLESLGHHPILAAGGAEALAIIEARGGELDAVFLDLRMPEMSGDDCYEEIRELVPHLPVVVYTGVVSKDRTERLRQRGVAAVLRKPMDRDQIQVALGALWPGA